jgi:hypothetical protein
VPCVISRLSPAQDVRGGQKPRLAVAVKRRVLLFELPPHAGAQQLAPARLMSEVELPGARPVRRQRRVALPAVGLHLR